MSDQLKEKTIKVESVDQVINLFGSQDRNIKVLEHKLNVSVVLREDEIKISGDRYGVELAQKVIKKLLEVIKSGEIVDTYKIKYAIKLAKVGKEHFLTDSSSDVACITYKGRPIKCKTLGQRLYLNSMLKNDIVFSIGPAGTGKTYLAMAAAVKAFKDKSVYRIILTRPAVEAGEKLGFLPGDLQNKVDPYLRPLYDALYDIIGGEAFDKYMERGLIEVAPLAYMRGRTLNDSFIILDEAQNTTPEQMKMFLTRMGFGSKVVVTGDITQTDLPNGKFSGLKQAIKILQNINGIDFVYLDENDVVRHELVKKIIRAYDTYKEETN
ncbi:MAG: PhoH family protein [Clostridia bacterium]|nr:PhoH family protein [Clostridia bacterium]